MSYSTRSIQDVIRDIEQNRMFLPALQRKFVWDRPQIELLFDSLIRNYPIGTFLFWDLHRENAQQYVFYEFLRDYDDRNPYNRRKTGAFTHETITGVLDGQQRLSSMFIGLMGKHTQKKPRAHRSNVAAYQPSSLHLNLMSLPFATDSQDSLYIREDQDFEFRFLTEEEANATVTHRAMGEEEVSQDGRPAFWFTVCEVLEWPADPEFERLAQKFADDAQADELRMAMNKNLRMISHGLRLLHKRICGEKLISFFTVAKDDLEDILKIFVRVNSGGTVLTKTDLLFSTIVATWSDGRERIETLQKDINARGDGFGFTNEFVMRCCLLLTDGPVVYKVNSFKAENVQRIRDHWQTIAAAITKMVDLLSEFGFSEDLLSSQNAVIIIAYHIFKGGELNDASKSGLRKYLLHALLLGTFGKSQEHVLRTLRNAMRKEVVLPSGDVAYELISTAFSFDSLRESVKSSGVTLMATEDNIEQFLELKKGPSTFQCLSLLYPNLRYRDVHFHQDHLHPHAGFTKPKLAPLGLTEDEIDEWQDLRDCLPNLQLLNGRENSSKKATPLVDWMGDMDAGLRASYLAENYFPDGQNLELRNFAAFYEKRKAKLRAALRKELLPEQADIDSTTCK